MRRADRRLYQPIRPTVVSARDGRCLPIPRLPVNDARASFAADLEAISADRPEVASVVRELLSVARQVAMMLPRPMLEQLVEYVIDHLDDLDGDANVEPIDEREPDADF